MAKQHFTFGDDPKQVSESQILSHMEDTKAKGNRFKRSMGWAEGAKSVDDLKKAMAGQFHVFDKDGESVAELGNKDIVRRKLKLESYLAGNTKITGNELKELIRDQKEDLRKAEKVLGEYHDHLIAEMVEPRAALNEAVSSMRMGLNQVTSGLFSIKDAAGTGWQDDAAIKTGVEKALADAGLSTDAITALKVKPTGFGSAPAGGPPPAHAGKVTIEIYNPDAKPGQPKVHELTIAEVDVATGKLKMGAQFGEAGKSIEKWHSRSLKELSDFEQSVRDARAAATKEIENIGKTVSEVETKAFGSAEAALAKVESKGTNGLQEGLEKGGEKGMSGMKRAGLGALAGGAVGYFMGGENKGTNAMIGAGFGAAASVALGAVFKNKAVAADVGQALGRAH